MKKKFLTVFAAAALVALGTATALSSCAGGNDESSTPTTSEAPTTSVTPTTSETPSTPETPTTSEAPSTSEAPTTSETPSTSETPTTSEDPTPEVVHVNSVTVTLSKAEIKVGETATVTVNILPENATDKTYTLSSSNTAIATIEDNVVTAVAPGVATIKAVSTDGNVEGTAELTVKIVMVDPKLSNEGEESYTVAAGQDLTLPTIKALSGDGTTDISDYVEVEDEDDKNSISKDGKTFNSKIAGEHNIVYYVEEGEGDDVKSDELSITITVTPATPETTLDKTTYDPAVAGTYGTFADGFQEGTSSKLYKGIGDANHAVSLSATDDAIAGNSLIIDLNRTAGTALNGVFLNLFGDDMIQGSPVNYEVSFDYKPLAGSKLNSNTYFGIRYDGFNGTNVNFAQDTTIGKVSHFSHKFAAFTIPTGSTHPGFFFFNLEGDGDDCRIAIDNFKVTFSEPATATNVTPTSDELQAEGGYTFDWKNKSGTFGGQGEPVKVSSLDDSIKNALDGVEGFSENVMHLFGADGHILSSLDGTNLIGGKKIKITYKYYAINDNAFNMIVMAPGGITMNDGLKITTIEGNLKQFVWEATLPNGSIGINFYPAGNANYDVYVGDMNVQITDADPIPEDETALGYKVGQKWTNTKRTFGQGLIDAQVQVTNDFATPEGVTGEQIGDKVCKFEFTAKTKNDANVEWYRAENKQIEIGHEYKLSIAYYVESMGDGVSFKWNIDNSAFLPDGSATLPTSVGYHEETLTWTATKSADFVSLYFMGEYKTGVIYIANTTVELTKINK